MLGPSLEDVRQKMQLMPTPMLMQYKSNPGQQQAGGIPMDMLAGLELSRRAQMQQQQQAAQAQGAQNQPTVVDAAAQQLGLGSLVPQGQPQQRPPMPPPQMAQAPQPQQRPPMPPPQMAQAPQSQQPPPQMAQAPQPQGQPQRLAKGGAIAFAAGEGVPYTNFENDLERQKAALNDLNTELSRPGLSPAQTQMLSTEARRLEQEIARQSKPAPPHAPSSWIEQQLAKLPPFAPKNDPLAGLGSLARARAVTGVVPEMGMTGSDIEKQVLARGAPPRTNGTSNYIDPRRLDQRPYSQTREENMASVYAEPPMSSTQPSAEQQDDFTNWAKTALTADSRQKALYKTTDDLTTAVRGMSPTQLSEDQAAAFKKRNIQENRAITDPFFQQYENLLKGQAPKESTAGTDAWMRLGLGMMGGRGSLASIMSRAGLGALDYYDSAKKLEAAEKNKHFEAQVALVNARRLDEAGHHKEAQQALAAHERALKDAQDFNLRKAETISRLQEPAAKLEQQDQSLARQLYAQSAAAKKEADKQAALARKESRLKPEEALKLAEFVNTNWQHVRSQYLDPKIMSAIEKGLSKDPAVVAAEAAGKARYKMSLLEGTGAYQPPSADAVLRSFGG